MKRSLIIILGLCLLAMFSLPGDAADGDKEKKKPRQRIVIPPHPGFEFDIEIPDFEWQLKDYEAMLEGLDGQLGKLDIRLRRLDDLQLKNLEELRDLADLHIVIPDVAIPPIPPIDIHIPDIRIDGMVSGFDWDVESLKLFRDLSDEEQLRLQALRSLARRDADQAIPALEKTLREDASAALRYEAVRQLGGFLEDSRVVPLLGKAAKNDKNLAVRKKAVRLLSKSKDPRAVEILEEIVGK